MFSKLTYFPPTVFILLFIFGCGKPNSSNGGGGSDPIPQPKEENFCVSDSSPKEQALELLKKKDPDGYSIYMRQPDKKEFVRFLDLSCKDPYFGLPTAVHENVHILDGGGYVSRIGRDGYLTRYLLVGGKEIILRDEDVTDYTSPFIIKDEFDQNDHYVNTYFINSPLSAAGSSFFYLLDELNAYTNELRTVINLASVVPSQGRVSYRDGVLAFMAFVKAYLHRVRLVSPNTWDRLMLKEKSSIVKTLWSQANETLNLACQIPNIGLQDREWALKVYSSNESDETNLVLGTRIDAPPNCQTLHWQ